VPSWTADPTIDYRKHPQLYKIGRGEQGVLIVEPYKSELLPHWKFKTPAEARRSAAVLYRMFRAYLQQGDFVGADMARKYIQMGWTRARRYANHRSGRKYKMGTRQILPSDPDPIKAQSAAIFFATLEKVKRNATYRRLRTLHQAMSNR
jgi:hypothetical protein